MSQNVLVELSDALADAAEKAGKATVLVNARRRMPASGIAYAADLILTADHVVEREEDITVILRRWNRNLCERRGSRCWFGFSRAQTRTCRRDSR